MTVGKVRHPITMFVVTVLAVIGLGVGVVTVTTISQAPRDIRGMEPKRTAQ